MNPSPRFDRSNPNANPRPLATWIASFFLRPLLRALRIKPPAAPEPWTVFESYSVGDVYMALPALKLLARQIPLRIICRPDCAALFRAEGFEAVPFDNAYAFHQSRASFFRTLRSAWSLRGLAGSRVLDLDGDSRTAFWLKIAGVARVVSYRRPRTGFFDALFPVDSNAAHKTDWNLAVVRDFRRAEGEKDDGASGGGFESLAYPAVPGAPGAPWLLSCWTRLDIKNWPIERWDEILRRLTEAGVPLRVLEPPDGDATWLAFRARWSDRGVAFLSAPLMRVVEEVKASAGVVVSDNFFGHMAGYYGKPVLWINGSSDPAFVIPRGPRTVGVQYEPMPCRSCHGHCVNPEYKACLNRLPVEDVWRGFETLTAAPAGPGL